MREILHNNLMSKIHESTLSHNVKHRKCNYSQNLMVDRACIFQGKCRTKCVIYKATCIPTGKVYIRKTAIFLKQRFSSHYNDAQALANVPLSSSQELAVPASSLSHHLSEIVNTENADEVLVRAADVRNLTLVEVIWKGDPISCLSSFGEVSCKLCMKEKVEILKFQ